LLFLREEDTLLSARADFLTLTVSNIPGKDLLMGNVSSRAFGVSLALVSAAYGGLHAWGWNHYFPTYEEGIMWRISAVAVVAGGIAASFVIVSKELLYLACAFLSSFSQAIDVEVATEGAFFLYVFYCCCRIFLVVEAFISIRKLPASAYKTPAWSQLLPHL
jgi:hypothetical protein